LGITKIGIYTFLGTDKKGNRKYKIGVTELNAGKGKEVFPGSRCLWRLLEIAGIKRRALPGETGARGL